MGGAGSRRKKPTTSVPQLNVATGSPTMGRAGIGTGLATPINREQQRELMVANQRIQDLTNQLNARTGGMGMTGMPYGGYPNSYAPSPMMGSSPPYGQMNPLFQGLGGQSSFPQLQPPQFQPGAGAAVYRDTDFSSIANIAGLNPADIAILHREFMNLTNGGATKIDRTIFRQILRDAFMELNNKNVDQAIESLFVHIDRNRDGFIDFPEFVGGFKDVLKHDSNDLQAMLAEGSFPDSLVGQMRAAGVGSGVLSQPVSLASQPISFAAQPLALAQPAPLVTSGGLSIVPLASMGFQQNPIMYGASTAPALQFSNANPPMLTLDQSQSSYVIATPGQYMITQPTALQCVPLPMM